MAGDGSFGGLYFVDELIIGEIITACVNDVIQLLEGKPK